MLFLLQADTLNVPVTSAGEGLSLFSLIMKGGWVMFPIFILSFIAVYIFIERLLSMHRFVPPIVFIRVFFSKP